MSTFTFCTALFTLGFFSAVWSAHGRLPSSQDIVTKSRVLKYRTTGTAEQISKARANIENGKRVLENKRRQSRKADLKAQKKGALPYTKQAAVYSRVGVEKAEVRLEKSKARLRRLLRKKAIFGLTIKINGEILPTLCYCKKQAAGESKCYFFTRGNYCAVRYCATTYACVGKGKARGSMCRLRKVGNRIVPTGENTCKEETINSHMYTPYTEH